MMHTPGHTEEFTILYHSMPVGIILHKENGKLRFQVYLAGEEGHLELYSETDVNGNESWYENGAATPRAQELGELIEAAGDDIVPAMSAGK